MTDRRKADGGDRRIADRRRSTRSKTDCKIRILSSTSPDQIVPGVLVDVSASGLRLRAKHAISVGAKLLVEARHRSKVVCNVTVQVIWTELESTGEYLIGCESLSELSPRQLNQLKSVAVDHCSFAMN